MNYNTPLLKWSMWFSNTQSLWLPGLTVPLVFQPWDYDLHLFFFFFFCSRDQSTYTLYLFVLIESIGVILVHETLQVSSVQLNKTSSAHCIVLPWPQAKSLSIRFPCPFAHLHLPTPTLLSLWLSLHCCLCLFVLYILYNIYYIYHI